jgi:hypothetical protein
MSFGESLKWVESSGGPLILLDADLLEQWGGVSAEGDSASGSDYDLACSVNDYLGRIAFRDRDALVLDDEPLPTAWYEMGEVAHGLLVRWVHADDEASAVAALSDLQGLEWEAADFEVHFSQNNQVLFDAACDASEVGKDLLRLTLPMGRYRVETAHLAPDPKTSLLLHRFVPSG